MEYRIFESTDELALACADIFTALLKEKPNAVLGLATGASPVKTYKELIRRYEAGEISFAGVTTFNLDEYCDLPKDDKNSYYTFMHENLFDHVDIKEENTHLMDGNAADPEAEAAAFDAMIEQAGGVDIQLLGVGRNGHIGFNEPATPFDSGTHVQKLTRKTRAELAPRFGGEENVPVRGVTQGFRTLCYARDIVVIAHGAEKATALYRTLYGRDDSVYPAAFLQLPPNVTVYADEEASAQLE